VARRKGETEIQTATFPTPIPSTVPRLVSYSNNIVDWHAGITLVVTEYFIYNHPSEMQQPTEADWLKKARDIRCAEAARSQTSSFVSLILNADESSVSRYGYLASGHTIIDYHRTGRWPSGRVRTCDQEERSTPLPTVKPMQTARKLLVPKLHGQIHSFTMAFTLDRSCIRAYLFLGRYATCISKAWSSYCATRCTCVVTLGHMIMCCTISTK
jgi:hypothetical protein